MENLINLIKESIDLSVRMRWLKQIEKSCDKRNKLYQAYQRECLVIEDLVKKFNELYPDDKLKRKE
jgi:hypothetical protein